MKTYLLLLLIGFSSVAALAQDNQTPYETRSLANDAIKNVFVKASGGNISVSGAVGQSARVEVYIRGNNNQELSKEEIKKRLDEDYELQIAVSNHELHVQAKRKHEGGFGWDWKRQLNISFKVYVPKNTDTHIGTSGGSIHLDNLAGNENFNTSGGSLHVNMVTGIIRGETSGGSIEVVNAADDISLETSGGSINAVNCHGKIKLETSGGSLHLESLKGSVTANTSGGSIHANDIEGELITGTSGGSVSLEKMACSLEASTSGGSMNVDMIRVGKYLKLDVNGGHVNLKLPANQGLDLDLNANHISPATSTGKFNGEWSKEQVKGHLNGGGAPVRVDASGRIDLVFN